MMVAPRFLFALVVLTDFSVRRSSKFTAPDHQRIVEQSALFEVGDKGGGGLITIEAKFAVALVVVGVGVPGLVVVADVIDGHKTDAVLHEPPRQQTGARERRVASQVADVLRLTPDGE